MQNLHGIVRSVGSVITDSTQVGLLDGLITRKKYLSRKESSIIPGSSTLLQIHMRETVPLKGFPYTLGSVL